MDAGVEEATVTTSVFVQHDCSSVEVLRSDGRRRSLRMDLVTDGLRYVNDDVVDFTATISSSIMSHQRRSNSSTVHQLHSSVNPNDTTPSPKRPWHSASSVSLHYSLATMILVALLLFVVILSTALGNLLVFVALFRSRYLRTVSNYLIGNLALSDFLLATTILPLSTVNECLGHWVFGRVLCNFWLTMDVLYCTASIWNLCVIAFDRFTATLYPIWYRDKRSTRQAGIYAALVWIISATICVPPLLGWNDLSQNYVYDDATDVHHCILFQTRSYVVYSAFGSFYVPFLVTLCLYIRIFVVLRARIKRNPSSSGFRGALNAASVRGDSGRSTSQKEPVAKEGLLEKGIDGSRSSCPRLVRANAVCVEGETGGGQSSSDPGLHRGQSDSDTTAADQRSQVGHGQFESGDDPVLSIDDQSISGQESLGSIDHQPSTDVDHGRRPFASSYRLKLKAAITRNGGKRFPRRQEAFDLSTRSTTLPPTLSSVSASAAGSVVSISGTEEPSICSAAERRRKFLFSRKSCQSLAAESGSRSTSQRQRYEQREMRATIRMSIIIAFFCGMWVGFFTVYMVHGCCPDCFIPRALDALFFWLGYSNSSVNPILYTIFNEEFRRAFQKILGWYTVDQRKLSSRK